MPRDQVDDALNTMKESNVMGKPMTKSASIEIDVPAAVAWQAVGEEFGKTAEWTSELRGSYLDSDEVGVGVSRVCQRGKETLVETLTKYDPDTMTYTYELQNPGNGVKSAVNSWTVEPLGENRCRVTTTPTIQLGWWLKPMMALFIGSVLKKVLEELKYWVETGTVHPRKAKHTAKHGPVLLAGLQPNIL